MARRALLLCLLLCSIGPGLAGWNGYGKGWGQQQNSRSDYSFRSNHKGSGSGGSGKGAWPDSNYTWEAGYVAGLKEMEKKRSRKKPPASSSDVTPESTPEKPKSKQWRKVKSELDELRNFKSKIEQAEAEKVQEQKLADLEQRLTSRLHAAQHFAAAPAKATDGVDGPKEDHALSKVQQKLAARMLDLPPEEAEFGSWLQLENTIGDMEGKDLAGILKSEGLAVPKANKERQRALCGHLRAELGLEA